MDEYNQITQAVNKLFVFTDQRQWQRLQSEVFADAVRFDMSSLGGENATLTPQRICEVWRDGFAGIDSVNHLAGNYLISIDNEEATVFAYATATHYKNAARNGHTREFTGTYDLHLVKKGNGWRIDSFKYQLKYAQGNLDLS